MCPDETVKRIFVLTREATASSVEVWVLPKLKEK